MVVAVNAVSQQLYLHLRGHDQPQTRMLNHILPARCLKAEYY
jgi:hypothetical protein